VYLARKTVTALSLAMVSKLGDGSPPTWMAIMVKSKQSLVLYIHMWNSVPECFWVSFPQKVMTTNRSLKQGQMSARLSGMDPKEDYSLT